jgi:hypothetical protein
MTAAATPSVKTGAFLGGVLGLPAGLLLATAFTSGSRNKASQGKIVAGATALGGAAGTIIGAGGTCGCPTGDVSPRTGALAGAVLGMPAGLIVGALLSSFTKNKAAKGKAMIGGLAIGTVAGGVIGASIRCNACALPPPGPPTPPTNLPPPGGIT